ncbi:MAG: hypothetical protein KF729_24310 [Sandaracinaceae bacterium]|nr:hypothetical protein [Sandaracinaceae bacterium]
MVSADVLVVGGGSAGWGVAGMLAGAGRDVLVVDRRVPAMAGARWLNLVPGWCFDEARVPRPEPPERWGGAHGASHLRAAGTGAAVRIEGQDGLHIDMRLLVARLRARALASGAREARGVLRGLRGGRRIERAEVEGLGDVRARLVVDASGLAGAVRRRAPWLAVRCPEVAPEDLCSAAEFQFEVRDPAGLSAFLARHGAAPGDSVAFLGLAGGYSTLTVFSEPTLSEVGVLAGSIPAAGAPNGPRLLAAFARERAWLGRRLFGGQGAIPVRRPYRLLARGGVALVGDSACQVYGSHGSGVGMGLIAARTLADALAREDDPGRDDALEAYTHRFHRRHGGLLAGADAFRRLSQGLDRETLAALMQSGMLDARALASGVEQRLPAPDARWILSRAARAATAPRAAAEVGPTVAKMLALSALGALTPDSRALGARVHHALVRRLVGPTPRGAGDGRPVAMPHAEGVSDAGARSEPVGGGR